jgi:hypothetical protein
VLVAVRQAQRQQAAERERHRDRPGRHPRGGARPAVQQFPVELQADGEHENSYADVRQRRQSRSDVLGEQQFGDGAAEQRRAQKDPRHDLADNRQLPQAGRNGRRTVGPR